jgi:hypothetical protein
MHSLYSLKILGPIVGHFEEIYVCIVFFFSSLIRDDDEENVDTDWIMTIKQADNDLKKQLMNGDKTPDQVNNETNHLLLYV